MQATPNMWRFLLMAACVAFILLALSKTDVLSCERQNAPRVAQQQFFTAAAQIAAGRAQGDRTLAAIVPVGRTRSALVKLIAAEERYHNKALQLARQAPPLVCSGPFPTAH